MFLPIREDWSRIITLHVWGNCAVVRRSKGRSQLELADLLDTVLSARSPARISQSLAPIRCFIHSNCLLIFWPWPPGSVFNLSRWTSFRAGPAFWSGLVNLTWFITPCAPYWSFLDRCCIWSGNRCWTAFQRSCNLYRIKKHAIGEQSSPKQDEDTNNDNSCFGWHI